MEEVGMWEKVSMLMEMSVSGTFGSKRGVS